MSPYRTCVIGLAVFAAIGPANATPQIIGTNQRSSLGVTLYSTGLALINDQRKIKLTSGNNELLFSGVSPLMINESAQLESSEEISIDQQELLPANLTRRELLVAHLGKTIKVIKTNPMTGEEQTVDAEILSTDPALILRIGGRIVTDVSGQLAFPGVPKNLRAKPVFRIIGTALKNQNPSVRLHYLTRGFSWRADYVAMFDTKTKKLNLKTRAMLVNTSGFDLLGSQMQLVAGQVRQVTPQRRAPNAPRLMKAESMARADVTPGLPTRQNLSGYHLYDLNGLIDLAAGTQKQVQLLPALALSANRILVSVNHPNIYGRASNPDQPSHPMIQIHFANKSADGTPLPTGTLRMYGTDKKGHRQFLGEDRLGSVPVGATAQISTGQAFDVTVLRKQTDFKRDVMGRNSFEAAYDIRLQNGGMEDEVVKVVENLSGDWTITYESAAHKRDGNQAQWRVTVPAGGHATVSYRARVKR